VFFVFSIKRQSTLSTVLVGHASLLYSHALVSLPARNEVIQDMTASTADEKATVQSVVSFFNRTF